MEELNEASPYSKMEHQDEIPEPVDETDGSSPNIQLPEQLQKINPLEEFVSVRHRWNTNEEIASILIAFDRHKEWLVLPQKIRPASGSMLLYNRKVVFYRRDGYCWKKRRNGSTIREDHMKLKVQGLECIYGSYVHSAILPTFHRRCYWLLQNPNIVLIHYLNVPYPEAAKPSIPLLSYELSQKSWTKEELVDQLRPMLSRATEGTEHDTEDDQKVEKMLDEFLPLLLPNQETTKCITSRPLAPAPNNTVPSSSYLAPASTPTSLTSLKRPIRTQASCHQPQVTRVVQAGQQETRLSSLHQVHDSHAQVPATFTAMHSSMLSGENVNAHQHRQQKTTAQIPISHSFTYPYIQNSQSSLVTSSSNNQIFSTANLLQVNPTGYHQIGNLGRQEGSSSSCTNFLNQAMTNSTLRFVAVGNDALANSNMPGREDNSSEGQNTDFRIQQVTLPSEVYSHFGTSMPSSSSSPLTSYLANSLSSAVGREKGAPSSSVSSSSSPSSLMSINVNQFSLNPVIQRHISLNADPQQPQVPVLTLHLKPVGNCSSDMPGIVLSLQEATIVSQQGDQSSGLFGPHTSQAVNLSNGQGLVLVASQTPGGFFLNRISSNPQAQTPAPNSLFVSPQEVNLEAPQDKSQHNQVLSPFREQPQKNVSSPQFIGSPVVTGTSLFTHPDINANPAHSQPFSYESSVTSTAEFVQRQPVRHHGAHGSEFTNMFPPSIGNGNTFPVKTENVLFHFKNELSDSEKYSAIKREDLHAASYNSKHGDVCSSSFGGCVMTSDNHPIITWALSNNVIEPSSSFPSQTTASQPQLIHAVLQQQPQQQSHQREPPEGVAGPSGLSTSVKDMITNPNSCDTLDGSFSSLPSADLNLDDLLDLNDLDDVTDLGCSPFTPSGGLSEQPLSNTEMTEVEKETEHGHVAGMNLMAQGQRGSCVNESTSTFGSISSAVLYQQNPHLATSLHSSSTSSLHQAEFPCSMTSSFSSILGNPLACDAADVSGGQEEADPENNSVIKDFSPDWAYTKCEFKRERLCAYTGEEGVCLSVNHSPGYVTLQVARDGVVVSNCEIFEFCDRESRDSSTTHPEWFALDYIVCCLFAGNQLKLLLIERLDHMSRHFVNATPPLQGSISDDMETLERNLVHQVQTMTGQHWTDSNLYPKAGQHNLTLLHLAAALGFAKLISCLIRWRVDNNCVALEFEVDAQSVDSHACTPLMWACALGKIDAALTLYHWNTSPLKMCNKDGLLPLTLARQKGFYNLANQVEQLERAKEQQQQQQLQNRAKEQSAVHRMEVSHTQLNCNSVHSYSQAGELATGSGSDHEKEDSELKDSLIDIRPVPSPAFSKPGKIVSKLVRRYSEQVIGHQSRPLSKRNSVDLLPSGQDTDQAVLPSMGSPMNSPIQDANSEPRLPVSPDMAFVAPPAPRLPLEDEIDEPSVYTGEPSISKMDTDEVVTVHSPLIDVERISSDEEVDANKDGNKHQMVTLANQIIAAIPERIKLSPSKADEVDDASSSRGRSESHSSLPSQGSPRPSSFGDDSGISTPMTDSLAFEEYRYPEFGTPASSLSPDSTCLPSPYSPYSFTLDSPPPTTAEFTEYFNAPTTYMEKDFSQLTLSDQEQRKLYEAAKVIQNAYRHYRDKQQQQQQLQQQKEIEAAILIQSYYRRYKTYAYYKKMSHAAVLIQNQFRTYYAKRKKRGDTGAAARRELERLKKGRNQSVIIQQRFRSHYQRRSLDGKEDGVHVQGSSGAAD
ncbi:unnamed protein product, partial [Candidula unifasciata]